MFYVLILHLFKCELGMKFCVTNHLTYEQLLDIDDKELVERYRGDFLPNMKLRGILSNFIKLFEKWGSV